MDDREMLIFFAKFSEQAERFDQMASCMRQVADTGVRMTNEERNLYSVAYKNKVGARRSAWRIIRTLEDKVSDDDHKKRLTKEYRKKIEKELKQICYEVLDTLDQTLIPKCGKEVESMVFYLKMKGDYHRYLQEVADLEDRGLTDSDSTSSQRDDSAKDEAEKAYLNATRVAKKELPSTHPIRLGLALNFSVFYYEIAKSPEKACNLAKDAFDAAITELDSLKDESYKDSTLIMQLLRDNLTLWTADNSSGED